jgi:hypothetical protein
MLPWAAAAAQSENLIIHSTGTRQDLKQRVQAVGGVIHHEFRNITAVSATVPSANVALLSAIAQFKIARETQVAYPLPKDPRGIDSGVVELEAQTYLAADPATIVRNAQKLPSDYLFNNSLINAASVQASGNLGDGVVVAIIDSGTANNPSTVFSLAGSVIGGESFVPASQDAVTSATSTKNGAHGTWVGTMIAGHGLFGFSNTSCFARSVQMNAPDSALDGALFGAPGLIVVPMIGVAPEAKLYALKVFPSGGGSSPSSRIIAAMDRAITIKKNFLNGVPSVPVSGTGTEDDPFVYDSLNIQVVNMSLGGATLIAGRETEDELVAELLKVGITVAISAGNAGPSGITTGSPSTGFGSIATAAALSPQHERILADQPSSSAPTVCRLGRGLLYHPTNHLQTSYFSSRGPTADGRDAVDVISEGDINFVQSANGGISLVSGTSFSAPTVAGAAALLRKGVPNATAIQVRNALISGANPFALGDHSSRFDQGRGYLNVAGSLALLKTGRVSRRLPPEPHFSDEVGENLHHAGIPTYDLESGRPLRFRARNLVPGEREEFVIEVGKNVQTVTVNLDSVTPKLPPASQNQLFGDDVLFAVHTAKTSEFRSDVYAELNFFNGPTTVTISDPEPGFVRITVLGDWTNVGSVSASLSVTSTEKTKPVFSQSGTLQQGDLVPYTFNMPSGVTSTEFLLNWKHDWSSYPTNDLDLLVVDPDGKLIMDGATLDGRERVIVANPKAGVWTLYIDAFTVYGPPVASGKDRFTLRVFNQ